MSKITAHKEEEQGGRGLSRRQVLTGAAAGGLALVIAAWSPRRADASTGVSKGNLRSADLGSNALFEITGVPGNVAKSKMEKTANESKAEADARKDVVHTNDILLNTEHWIAEPGNRTLNVLGVVDEKGKFKFDINQAQTDLGDIQAGAAWLLTPDYQRTFSHDEFPFPLIEGGYAMITGAGMDLEFENKEQSAAALHLGAKRGHTWLVLARGFPRDYVKDTDPNAKIVATGFNTGFVMGTILPPGQFVSQDYFKQNVAAGHGEFGARDSISCGTDGCTGVSAVMFDIRTGAYTWINQKDPKSAWSLVQTNIK